MEKYYYIVIQTSRACIALAISISPIQFLLNNDYHLNNGYIIYSEEITEKQYIKWHEDILSGIQHLKS